MKLVLTCGKCLHEWAVEQWTPTAMHCPKCGSERLSDGLSAKEQVLRDAKHKESERRKQIALEKKAHP